MSFQSFFFLVFDSGGGWQLNPSYWITGAMIVKWRWTDPPTWMKWYWVQAFTLYISLCLLHFLSIYFSRISSYFLHKSLYSLFLYPSYFILTPFESLLIRVLTWAIISRYGPLLLVVMECNPFNLSYKVWSIFDSNFSILYFASEKIMIDKTTEAIINQPILILYCYAAISTHEEWEHWCQLKC